MISFFLVVLVFFFMSDQIYSQNLFSMSNSLILSAAGLKNIVLRNYSEDQFEFIFGSHSIRMNKIFADFFSPLVSKIHQADPTVDSIDFTNKIETRNISEETFSLLKEISGGSFVEFCEEQRIELRMISIVLQNEELFSLLSEDKESTDEKKKVEEYLKYLKIFGEISEFDNILHCTDILRQISSHFYDIDKDELKTLGVGTVYSIISSDFLVVESEDSLFEFIEEIINDNKEMSEEDKISFYEELEIRSLSENKFNEVIDGIDIEYMTKRLWTKLCCCFYTNKEPDDVNVKRYISASKNVNDSKMKMKGVEIEFDGNSSHRFEGVIHYLTEKSGGNVSDKGTVNVTSSSNYSGYVPRNAVDLDNTQNYFQASNDPRDWLRYDFIENKVIPTHYSIRTRHDCDGNHPRSWVIEGSNTGGESDSEWTILDSHQNDSTLRGPSFSYTFDITNKETSNEGYRYLRIRQTGYNSTSNHYTAISALEYFGSLIEE